MEQFIADSCELLIKTDVTWTNIDFFKIIILLLENRQGFHIVVVSQDRQK